MFPTDIFSHKEIPKSNIPEISNSLYSFDWMPEFPGFTMDKPQLSTFLSKTVTIL